MIPAFTIFGISVSVVTGTVVYSFLNPVQKFSKLATHIDDPNQPLTTYDDSKQIGFPNDLSGLSDSSCKTSGTNWVADENRKTGVALQESDWKNIDLRIANGSALWLNRTSASCGDLIKVHASLYGNIGSDKQSKTKTIHAWRIGWYNGAGARDVWQSKPIELKRLGFSKPRNNLRMIETTWPTTMQFQVGSDWVPGFYLIVTEDAGGKVENAAPLVS